MISLTLISISVSSHNHNEIIELGRDKDPKKIEDVSRFKIFLNKAKWEIL